jgi:1,4-alpha-glucan branching enzyme
MADMRRQATAGVTCIVLHSHLPYVHHPEFEDFLEEDWLFEAMCETYLPLLFVMRDLQRDGVPFRLAFSMTPPLVSMLRSPALVRKFEVYLAKRLELSRRELGRYAKGSPFHTCANHYVRRYAQMHELFVTIGRDIPAAFKELQDDGSIEILASAATHGYLPLLLSEESVRAQIALGVANYSETFGRKPRGFWLPECAYRPGLDRLLRDAGIEWVPLETHALECALPTPRARTFRPVTTPAGLTVLARDGECSRQVWSAQAGYPGDPHYRELYRDLGFDGDYRLVRPFLKPDGVRRNLGIKYHRITGKVGLHEKEPYDPDAARERAAVHAGNFLFNRSDQARRQRGALGEEPLVLAPFDCELFGHWWYEGPWFLDQIFRQAAQAGDGLPVAFATPSEALAWGGSRDSTFVHASSWGAGGFYRVWLNETNHWLWPHLHAMEEKMIEEARNRPDPPAEERRLLNQMARELVLAQSSDWLFILTMQTSAYYAEQRFRNHVHRFFALLDALYGKPFEEGDLKRVERNDAIFPQIDYRVYAPA